MVRLVRRFSGGEFYDEYGDEISEKEPGEVPTYPHVIGNLIYQVIIILI